MKNSMTPHSNYKEELEGLTNRNLLKIYHDQIRRFEMAYINHRPDQPLVLATLNEIEDEILKRMIPVQEPVKLKVKSL